MKLLFSQKLHTGEPDFCSICNHPVMLQKLEMDITRAKDLKDDSSDERGLFHFKYVSNLGNY